MRSEFKFNGKTYKYYTMDIGRGPTEYIDVKVTTGPNAVVTHSWRQVPRDGPTWKKIMEFVRRKMTQKQAEYLASQERDWTARCMNGQWVVWSWTSDHVVEFDSLPDVEEQEQSK